MTATRSLPAAVPNWIDQAVERAVVLHDIDYLIGLAIDSWLYDSDSAGTTRTEVAPSHS